MTDLKDMFCAVERIISPQTQKVYSVIAEKNGAKLAINCSLFRGIVLMGIKGQTAGVTLRIIELMKPTGQTSPEFTAFSFIGTDKYAMSDTVLHLFRGQKYDLPVTSWPCTPHAFLASVNKQNVVDRLGEWITLYVEKSGGKMLLTSMGLETVLTEWLEDIPGDTVTETDLFKLPVVDAPNYPLTKPKSDDSGENSKFL